MKANEQELAQRVLVLLKLDSKNLYKRLSERREEYVEIYSVKRTRNHFPEIFHSRYPEASIKELLHCSLDTIQALDQFYTEVEEMYWYVMHTEDMPVTVEDNAARYLKRIENFYQTLHLYLDAELGINQEEHNIDSPSEESAPVETGAIENLFFDDNPSETTPSTSNEESN